MRIYPTWKRKYSTKSKKHKESHAGLCPRRNRSRHILIKLTKTKHKERILKATREKQQVTCKGNSIRLIADLSAETLQARKEWQDVFKVITIYIYVPIVIF